ncbi:GH39 family glycosyl hydrolase [Catalinimonas niigatensis]|uniref:GH39 family glycosyl hydrolase n=1 Tax=Catalinimonas niigatensis TaxID=1397264 RepID=UPI002665FE9E|nr:beta-xylosidase [Catalinimonas niigatensis]WPP50849.1 beta-xylosidase [Catalinimonas niigatensis]
MPVKQFIPKVGTIIAFLFLYPPITPPTFAQSSSTEADTVSIQVDFSLEKGEMKPIWAWWGYDEPNYTYMKDGKKLLSEIAALSPVPVYVRAHSLLVTDEGPRAALKWGSSNAYTEDENGNPVYDWTIIDKIFDTYIERGMKPMAQIGFMPKALSTQPEPYRHYWKPGAEYDEIYTGWAYPPKDYEKWAELVFQWVKHSVDRYGKKEVESWYWELWNEPNIGYWRGTTEEYIKLYDYTADAVKRALPTARMGGPETTGPGWDEAAEFLTTFLDHIISGKNHVTGEIGAPLDFITFHAKGNPKLVDGVVQMDMGKQLRDIDRGFEIVASYPSLKDLPIIIGESDPEGCAACSEEDYPHNAYRNGTMYSSYTAASFARKYDLADHHGVNLLGAVTWGFEFEDQPWFAGFRDMATNGVDKPVLNVFRMFGMMQGKRVEVSSHPSSDAGNNLTASTANELAYDFEDVRDVSVRGENPDINALAAVDDHTATVMVWNYHDDYLDAPASSVAVNMKGIPVSQALLHHYRIDQENSNAYEVWKEMGSPQNPSEEQIAELEKAGQLTLLSSPEWVKTEDGEAVIQMNLPRRGVSLLKLSW